MKQKVNLNFNKILFCLYRYLERSGKFVGETKGEKSEENEMGG